MALGTAASGPGGQFLRLINSRDLNKYKFNHKIRSIHVFTFRETQNPDRLDTFDFDKLTLKIIISARKHQTFQFFAKNTTIVMFNFDQNFRSIG
jgi:TolB-like protein